MSVFLCGNTGFINRGCEAIAVSTAELLGGRCGDIYLTTFHPGMDKNTADRLGLKLIPYGRYPTPAHRLVCGAVKRILPTSYCGTGYIEKALYEKLRPGDTALAVGGDVYCCSRPIYQLAFNKHVRGKDIRNVLWCCSVGEEFMTKEIENDLRGFTYIFAREKLTCDIFISRGFPKEKIIKVCDPAFFLGTKEVPLPEGFIPGNTVGINISDLVTNSADVRYKSIIGTIRYILSETDMNVCLIPHVYSIDPPAQDIIILRKIHDEINDERVSIVDKEYTCEEIKYIVSRCRFMIASRTHASIAAYSSGVPTLVIGYSVKSRGIAVDLFGGYEGYAVPYQKINDEGAIPALFENIMKNEDKIRARLNAFLPEYKKSLTDAVDKYICK